MAAFSVFVSMLFLAFVVSVSAEHSSPTVHQRDPQNKKALRKGALTPSAQLKKDIENAVNEALGVGHGIDQRGLHAIRRDIEPMWKSLAKNTQGRLDRRSLGYVVQRFFLRTYSLSIVGLEATHANNTLSEAALLTKYAPNYVRNVVEGQGATHGFAIEDAVAMIGALRLLVEHSGSQVLEDLYNVQGKDVRRDVSRKEIGKIMEGYMLRWMMSDDMESIEMLEANESLRDESFEDWHHIAQFANGRVASFEYARLHAQGRNSNINSGNVLKPHFSFADAQAMVGGIALSFGDFWATDCVEVKDSLMRMDHANTGRVKLSDFHGAALNGEWRFSESKDYLRQMGALDETSNWHGPRVIIPNYVQAPSNCIVTTEHFRVCCANECEQHLGELEAAIGAPSAAPSEILPVIGRLSSGFDDEPRLTGLLQSQLHEIARANSGKVPIHGRLFAQWLHYVFPMDCAFPHKSGTTSTETPVSFGDAFMASEGEMETNAATIFDGGDARSPEDEWKTQWSHEEELLIHNLHAPWEADFSTSALGLMLMAGACVALVKSGVISWRGGKDLLPTYSGNPMKSHYV